MTPEKKNPPKTPIVGFSLFRRTYLNNIFTLLLFQRMHSGSQNFSENVSFRAPGLKVLSSDRMEGGREGEGERERGRGGEGVEEWTDTVAVGGGVWLGEDGE